MILNPLEFQRYMQASAKRGNLRVQWAHGVPPHCTGDTIVLPILPAKATEIEYREQLHYANHEVDHVLYTNFKPMGETHCDALRSFLGYIWNGVEDCRIEWLGGKEYEGDRSNSDQVYARVFETALNGFAKIPATADPAEVAEMKRRLLPIMWFMNEANIELYSSAVPIKPMIETMLTPEAKEIVEKLKAGDYLDVLRNNRDIEDRVKGTAASFELAKRIFQECYGLDPEKELERLKNPDAPPPPKKPKPSPTKVKAEPKPAPAKKEPKEKKDGEGKGEGEPEKGDGKGDKPDEGDGDASDGQLGHESPPEDSDSEGRDEFVNVEYQEFLPNAHDAKPAAKRAPPTEGMSIDYSGHRGSKEYMPATKDEYMIGDFCRPNNTTDRNYVTENGCQHSALAAYEGASKGVSNTGFASRVRTRLQIRSKDRFESGVKRGKLQGSLLHRVTVPNAHELNQRVFKRRIVNDTLDTAVIFLGDGSGSMGGKKYGHMMSTAVQFNEAVGNVINIPIEIHSFTDNGNPLMFVHRDFATRRLSADELVRRMAIAGQFLAGNPDGDAIMWSYDRLRQRKEKRKLLIVASDGQPACSKSGDIDWYTKEVVRKIEDSKSIQIVGIGIMDKNVQRIYKENYVINDAAELDQALLALIDKKVR